MAINTLYVDGGVLKSIRQNYLNQDAPNIKLENFFQNAVFSLLQKKLLNSKYAWKFHPYKYSYSVAKIKEIDSFLHGDYFSKLVHGILGVKKFEIKYEIRKFMPGDYTLLHDAEKEKNGIDFVIDFSLSSASFGGHTTYLTETEEVLILNPAPNTLSFIKRDKGLMKFTKYVTHRQKTPILQVAGTVYC